MKKSYLFTTCSILLVAVIISIVVILIAGCSTVETNSSTNYSSRYSSSQTTVTTPRPTFSMFAPTPQPTYRIFAPAPTPIYTIPPLPIIDPRVEAWLNSTPVPINTSNPNNIVIATPVPIHTINPDSIVITTPVPSIPTTEPVVRSAETTYVINTNTGKFHYTWCSNVDQMKESNKWFYTGSRDEIVNMGYVPCKRCYP